MSMIEEYYKRNPTSKKLFDRACKIFPSGFTRGPFVHGPYPTFFVRAQGHKVWDVDGNEYIDYINNYGPLLLGHNHPSIVNKVRECMEAGFWMGAMSEWEVELAEKIVDMHDGIEQLLFADVGSAAVGKAVRSCRYITGKKKIAYKDGAYHGAYDSCWPLEPERRGGIPQELTDMLICMPMNDGAAAEKIIKENKDELACVLNEPTVGMMGHEHNEEYLEYNKRLREITKQYDIPLIMDEIVTGFRLARGGYGERFGIIGDYTTLNKVLGHGMPLACFGSSKENMKYWAHDLQPNSLQPKSAPLLNPGTMNDWKLAIAAGLGMIEELKPSLYEHLDKMGDKLRNGLRKIFSDLGIKAQVVGISSIFQVFFTEEQIHSMNQVRRSNRLLYRMFDLGLLNKGINVGKDHCSFLSSPMTEKEIDQTLEAMKEVLSNMVPMIKTIAPSLIERY